MIILSEYHGANSIRQAIVYRNDDGFIVRKTENGEIVYSQSFLNEETAQNHAEDWALGEKDE